MKDEQLIEKAFLTAQLLTGSVRQAEDVALEAIGSWERGESQDVLFQKVLHLAVRAHIELNPASSSGLPDELKAVFRLGPEARHCFVPRLLAGLPPQMCGKFLHLEPDEVDAKTCAALPYLVPADREPVGSATHV